MFNKKIPFRLVLLCQSFQSLQHKIPSNLFPDDFKVLLFSYSAVTI
ncbi:hypothetical protein CHCC20333_1266 [Bacillus paralicheniformis]|nr:hypothetical protein CHCC20333_1266 [Bacillus paralicheniformis]